MYRGAVFLIVSASTITLAKPVFSRAQLAPPSIETNTPMSVPTYRRWLSSGSTTIVVDRHVGDASDAGTVDVRPGCTESEDLNTWPVPVGLLNVDTVACTTASVTGSGAIQEITLLSARGLLEVQTVVLMDVDALAVVNTLPLCVAAGDPPLPVPKYTRSLLSGETPIAVTREPKKAPARVHIGTDDRVVHRLVGPPRERSADPHPAGAWTDPGQNGVMNRKLPAASRDAARESGIVDPPLTLR